MNDEHSVSIVNRRGGRKTGRIPRADYARNSRRSIVSPRRFVDDGQTGDRIRKFFSTPIITFSLAYMNRNPLLDHAIEYVEKRRREKKIPGKKREKIRINGTKIANQ